MITLTEKSDGFGSQFQKLIYSILIAEEHGFKYIYRPVKKIEHNYDNDPEFINKIEELMNLQSNYRTIDSINSYPGEVINVLGSCEVVKEFESKIEYYMKSESLKKLKAIFWKNKNRNFFQNDATNIALHIRRPNEMDNRTEGTDTPLDYYFDVIDKIKKNNPTEKKVFHIYSQATIEEFNNRDTENFVFHLNESLFETFIGMVAADILVTSKSCFSYTAALLNEGTIYYLPFWHCPAPGWIKTACEFDNVYFYFNDKHYPIYVTDETLEVTPYTFQSNGELWEQDSLYQFFKNIDKTKQYTIVDIGAQSGLYSLFAKFLPFCTFHAFEPFPATFDLLNENLKLNKINNVITHNLAISDKIGTAILNTSCSHNGLHTLGENPQRFNDIIPIEVKTTTLDNFFSSPVDYIKIDTQGYEYFILKGGKEIIKKYKPIMHIEYNATNMNQCGVSEYMLNELIEEMGYVTISRSSEEILLMHKSKQFFSNVFESEKFKNNSKKKIKIDIGLSYSAPMSEVWLSHEPELIVIGFEPNPDSVESILSKEEIEKRQSYHGNPIQKKYINERFFLLPCALSDVDDSPEMDFYKTDIDTGRSSLFEPNIDFDTAEKIKVPVFSLKEFFESFPFEKYEYIDYIKIDAQGSDLNILKGAGKYLSERVVYITAEPEHSSYKDCTSNTVENITNYLKSQGFERIEHENTSDPTYINLKFLHLKNSIYIYQDG